MLIGYARVSTQDQDTALQLDALKNVGVKIIYQEKASGASRAGRPELARCLASMGKGDTLVVYKIDRIARSLFDLLDILGQLDRVGATIKSVTEPLDTTNSMGVFVIQILGAVAQLERSMILERSRAGMDAARLRGVAIGRPRAMAIYDESALVDEYLQGDTTMKMLADKWGVSESVVKRAIYRVIKPGDYIKRLKV
jgi:DNA invertase Pin-like site-specific DNA recombinase